MANRGDVIVSLRRLGFGASGRRECFVVLQSNLLHILDTLIVAPLDEDSSIYKGDPLVVRITPDEAGAQSHQVILVHLMAAFPTSKFDAGVVGKLTARSMLQVDSILKKVLSLSLR